jgi:hypothetical protein
VTRPCFTYGWLAPEAATGPDRSVGRLRARLVSMRAELNALRPPSGVDPAAFYGEWLPYAIAFGLTPAWARYVALLPPDAPAAAGDPTYTAAGPNPWLVQATLFPAPPQISGGGHHGGFDGGHHHGGRGGGHSGGHDGGHGGF